MASSANFPPNSNPVQLNIMPPPEGRGPVVPVPRPAVADRVDNSPHYPLTAEVSFPYGSSRGVQIPRPLAPPPTARVNQQKSVVDRREEVARIYNLPDLRNFVVQLEQVANSADVGQFKANFAGLGTLAINLKIRLDQLVACDLSLCLSTDNRKVVLGDFLYILDLYKKMLEVSYNLGVTCRDLPGFIEIRKTVLYCKYLRRQLFTPEFVFVTSVEEFERALKAFTENQRSFYMICENRFVNQQYPKLNQPYVMMFKNIYVQRSLENYRDRIINMSSGVYAIPTDNPMSVQTFVQNIYNTFEVQSQISVLQRKLPLVMVKRYLRDFIGDSKVYGLTKSFLGEVDGRYLLPKVLVSSKKRGTYGKVLVGLVETGDPNNPFEVVAYKRMKLVGQTDIGQTDIGRRKKNVLVSPQDVIEEAEQIIFSEDLSDSSKADFVKRLAALLIPDKNAICIPMTYMLGDLGSLIDESLFSGRPNIVKVQIAYELCQRAAKMHGAGRIHCDMKPNNFLIGDVPGTGLALRLGDFGLSISKHKPGDQIFFEAGKIKFTPLIAPPESILEQPIDEKVDVWALGILILQLFIPKFYRCVSGIESACKLSFISDKQKEFLYFNLLLVRDIYLDAYQRGCSLAPGYIKARVRKQLDDQKIYDKFYSLTNIKISKDMYNQDHYQEFNKKTLNAMVAWSQLLEEFRRQEPRIFIMTLQDLLADKPGERKTAAEVAGQLKTYLQSYENKYNLRGLRELTPLALTQQALQEEIIDKDIFTKEIVSELLKRFI